MQVILLEKIAKLGSLGSIVNVKPGYARNYLIPQGKARRVTEKVIAEFEAQRAELEKKQSEILAAASAQAARLDGLLVQISQKAGVDGKLFGSVTSANITEELRKQDFPVEKSMIRMPEGQIKQIGDYTVTVVLHSEVSAHITVSVLGETTI
ncbi:MULTISPECIES: 50S ribosomal protein L9 [Nitrosomonas]|uniref:Large ribosomal subunit protein bL9 n=1 Tax=Nitrosomonas europaea (strain ATCC 19718 / CIP 103999 / KCTC 2705 / NBRC 14298) TaxID=228410 RepID=RL9_NITEU|nr:MULTISPECIES: 50S ribosomal protein L9 [Nitrosomonas]Q82XQ9.1 RecName: Full=Large ribosomal subunit protein bL9; AltName: Full=50S ribosomal protein L9 [Nitrosomonas europaea ATCC 19718]MCE7917216.1 50S ribosomal protein L9 [Nitrosomonas sp. PRO5]MDL1864227.1 50S ribosomal protein L9 [Betaproteobacteria bacterium PRO5]KXK40314.1 MAG: 50S ribosomal protein L9 [Nitrosomonas europaea]MBC6961185.1 50S ribosomal protein L9 [Nitrosomonas sp.]MDF0677582.1 50S ribosomal protein L9 [Nitrosomonas sp